jgi:hypothetical protein
MAQDGNGTKYDIEVSAELTENGFQGKAKSRAVAALDSLVGGLFNVPVQWLQGKADQIKASSDARVEMIQATSRAASQYIENNDELGRRAAENFIRNETRKQRNRESIAYRAQDELLALPPPKHGPDEAPDHIDEDWMNVFGDYAEKASSEHLQRLWAKVLAGEIRKPGAFSLATMRFIAEFDQKTAIVFQNILKDRINDRHIIYPKSFSGRVFDELTLLEDMNLIQTVNNARSMTITLGSDGYLNHVFGHWLVSIKGKTNQELRISIVILSRVGVEVASILLFEDNEAAVRELAEKIKEQGCTVEIAKITKHISTREVLCGQKIAI